MPNEWSGGISFVIPTTGLKPQLPRALRGISALRQEGATTEVVVVFDGARKRWSAAELARCTGEARLVVLEQEAGGPARARNLGARSASGELLVFLDDDCYLEPDFLETLMTEIREGSGNIGGGIPAIPEVANLWSGASHIVVEAFIESQTSKGEIGFLPSQNLAVWRSDWERSGGFDETFAWAGGEDREFCVRWLAQGGRLGRFEKARYVHDHPLQMRSYFRKHREYGAAAARLGRRGRPVPGRFVVGLFKRMLHVRPWFKAVPLAFALLVSQVAAITGAAFGPGKAEQTSCG
ncbi:MAG: glycosyltransferase [Bryobacteraceae bacterium]